jgi:transposase-like protein
MTILSAAYFHDEAAAFAKVESIVWPDGIVCPKCGTVGQAGALTGVKDKKGRERLGLKKCYACRAQFTVRVGTIFEASHVALHLWLQAVYLMASSKKGVSANQLHRTLGVTLKTAWFMAHRIREAMRDGALAPFGNNGGAVEVDETFIGHDKAKKPRGEKKGRGYAHKHKVLSLIDRGTGRARSMVVDDLKAKTLTPILEENIAREARIMTDEAGQYRHLNKSFAEHHYVRHGQGEYGRGEIHTNTIEGYFSIFKRGMKGVYQHCGKKHLHRYLAEFDFRYNERAALGVCDAERADRALRGIIGKRLTYRDS